MEKIGISRAGALLAGAEDVLILTHVRPDGDTAGSGCALCLGLRALGKRAYLAANPPSMKRYEKYMTPYFAPAGFAAGFVAAVDLPGPGQFPPGWRPPPEGVDLAIDHHGSNTGYAKYTCLEADSAATGELVYLILRAMDVPLSPDMAEALYAAVATDTGCFRTPGTTARTLSIAGALRQTGFDAAELTRRLFESRSPARLRLEAAMFSTMRFPRPGVCVMTLPLDSVRACGATEDDMDKLSTLTTVPEGVQTGLLLRQLPDGRWKVSLRTNGNPHAGEVMSAVGGGGHADAGGAVVSGPPQQIQDTLLAALEDHRL